MSDTPAPRLGAKLGPRIAMLVHQAIIHAHSQLAGLKHKLAMAIFNSISDMISNEVDVTMGDLYGRLKQGMDESHPQYPVVNFMHTFTGQLKALAGTGLQITGLLGTVSAIMNNELSSIAYPIIAANPGLLPDPGTITSAYSAGLVPYDEAMHDLASSGTQRGWGDRMLNLSFNRPALSDCQEMIRRGLINIQQAKTYLAYNGISGPDQDLLLATTESLLSPADAALAVLRGNMSQADGEAVATANGYTAQQFGVLIGNTGEPPGLMQLLEGYRRGFIDQATLEKGILQSRYRNEWIPLLEQLRYEPMSTADTVNAVVQNQMDLATAQKVASENGLDPQYYQTLVNTAGEPLSRTEMEQLYNRGLVTKNDVIQALRESRLKNKYNEQAFELHARLLAVGDLKELVRYGAMKEADAVAHAVQLGYSASDAASLVQSGSLQRIDAARNRVISSAESLYEIGAILPADLEGVVTGLGFSDEQARFVVQSSEFHKEATLTKSAINAIRSKYLGHHIDRNTASGLLDTLNVPASGRDYLLSLWDTEIQAFARVLTEAQIIKAVKNDLITADEGLARLLFAGYSQGDAELLLAGA